MALSMYHSATGAQAPHCIHAIGIGKTGAYMVEALLRTGEIEDMLEDPRARFTGLSIDIGDQDQHELKEYASGFDQRLEERGIPTDRAQVRTVSLDVPEKRGPHDQPQPLARVPEDGVPAVLLEPELRAVAAERHRDAEGRRLDPARHLQGDLRALLLRRGQVAGDASSTTSSRASTRRSCRRWC